MHVPNDSVRIRPACYLGGIPGQERRKAMRGTLHIGPGQLYVSKAVVLGVTVLGVKCGKVDVNEISSIDIDPESTQDQVAIFVHLKDGSTGNYRVKADSSDRVLDLIQPIATQLGIGIAQRRVP